METVSSSVGDYCGISTLISAIILILPCILFITRQNKIYSGFELYGEIPGDIFGSKAREQYLRKGGEVVRDGLAKVNKSCRELMLNGIFSLCRPTANNTQVQGTSVSNYHRDWSHHNSSAIGRRQHPQ